MFLPCERGLPGVESASRSRCARAVLPCPGIVLPGRREGMRRSSSASAADFVGGMNEKGGGARRRFQRVIESQSRARPDPPIRPHFLRPTRPISVTYFLIMPFLNARGQLYAGA